MAWCAAECVHLCCACWQDMVHMQCSWDSTSQISPPCPGHLASPPTPHQSDQLHTKPTLHPWLHFPSHRPSPSPADLPALKIWLRDPPPAPHLAALPRTWLRDLSRSPAPISVHHAVPLGEHHERAGHQHRPGSEALTAETGSECAGRVLRHFPVFTSHILTLSSNCRQKETLKPFYREEGR